MPPDHCNWWETWARCPKGAPRILMPRSCASNSKLPRHTREVARPQRCARSENSKRVHLMVPVFLEFREKTEREKKRTKWRREIGLAKIGSAQLVLAELGNVRLCMHSEQQQKFVSVLEVQKMRCACTSQFYKKTDVHFQLWPTKECACIPKKHKGVGTFQLRQKVCKSVIVHFFNSCNRCVCVGNLKFHKWRVNAFSLFEIRVCVCVHFHIPKQGSVCAFSTFTKKVCMSKCIFNLHNKGVSVQSHFSSHGRMCILNLCKKGVCAFSTFTTRKCVHFQHSQKSVCAFSTFTTNVCAFSTFTTNVCAFHFHKRSVSASLQLSQQGVCVYILNFHNKRERVFAFSTNVCVCFSTLTTSACMHSKRSQQMCVWVFIPSQQASVCVCAFSTLTTGVCVCLGNLNLWNMSVCVHPQL